MSRIHGIQERRGRAFYRNAVLAAGSSTTVLFDNDRRESSFHWIALLLRILGTTRDDELPILDFITARLEMRGRVRLLTDEEIAKGLAPHLTRPYAEQAPTPVDRYFNDFPGSLLQEPRGLVLLRMIVVPTVRYTLGSTPPVEEGNQFGVTLSYGVPSDVPPHLPRSLDVRPTLIGLETLEVP